MSTDPFHSLKDLCPGSYNWNIKTRVIRSWRGVSTKTGEEFKGLNLLLLDDKNFRIHAFVPGPILDKHEKKLQEGNICKISNFSVKDYRSDEKFRCINSDRQIIFTTYTKVEKLNHDDLLICNQMFDFYDLCDLGDIANDNIYLTDVIGVIERTVPLSKLVNRFNQEQTQIKFLIVDGRGSVHVTFWESLAEQFHSAMQNLQQYPAIIIIASAKVTSWQGTKNLIPQIEIANVSATKFYLNLDDHNVSNLRKMLNTPLFSKYDFSTQIPEKLELFCIEDIKKLNMDYVKKEVICEVLVKSVFATNKWYFFECSSCYQEIESREGFFKCYRCCERFVPQPYKKWRFYAQAEDKTGQLDIIIADREARSILPIKSFDNITEESSNDFPTILKSIENHYYTVKLEISSNNIDKTSTSYLATGIFSNDNDGSLTNMEETAYTEQIPQSLNPSPGSNIHLEDFSDLDVNSSKEKKKKKKKKKKTLIKKSLMEI